MIDGVKILGDGDLKKKLTVKATKFTKTASEKLRLQEEGRGDIVCER